MATVNLDVKNIPIGILKGTLNGKEFRIPCYSEEQKEVFLEILKEIKFVEPSLFQHGR